MKKFSQVNLLSEELDSSYQGRGIVDRVFYRLMKQSSVMVHLNIPKPIYFRAEIFCEDVQELSEILFTHNDLLDLLYHDFLLYVKKNSDPQSLYNLLIQINHNPAAVKHYIEVDEVNEYLPVLSKTINPADREKNIQTLVFRTKRKQALRGEVLLADLAEVYPDHHFTLEMVLEMLYIDFVEKLKRGENPQALNNIVRMLTADE
ncbi:hypothetical protein [Mycobacteroides abscessus]|uniref:hypothetical protein n=1 Tax=Mycobacteroides abscessus TaxID=36809 RepID=UPI0012FFE9C2